MSVIAFHRDAGIFGVAGFGIGRTKNSHIGTCNTNQTSISNILNS